MGSGSASAPTQRWSRGPWHRGDRLRLAFLTLTSAGGLSLCWWMVAGATDGVTQLAWTEAGIVALIVGAAAETAWLVAGHRAVSRLKRALTAQLATVATAMEPQRRAAGPDGGAVCAGPRMTRYHRGGCPLVQGKAVVWGSVEENVRAQRRPCGVCTP